MMPANVTPVRAGESTRRIITTTRINITPRTIIEKLLPSVSLMT
jgi:hypothetical protein